MEGGVPYNPQEQERRGREEGVEDPPLHFYLNYRCAVFFFFSTYLSFFPTDCCVFFSLPPVPSSQLSLSRRFILQWEAFEGRCGSWVVWRWSRFEVFFCHFLVIVFFSLIGTVIFFYINITFFGFILITYLFIFISIILSLFTSCACLPFFFFLLFFRVFKTFNFFFQEHWKIVKFRKTKTYQILVLKNSFN